MYVIPAAQIREDTPGVGQKTRRLATLLREGFPVPAFVAVPAGVVGRLAAGDSSLTAVIVQEITEVLHAERYAVRSSALAEDDALHSLAGQFRTVLDQPASELAVAILTVIQDASRKLPTIDDTFSVIVQTYVPAQVAGVTFTRHPLGNREMVVEYHHGIGEKVVGGEVRPERLRFYWHQDLPHVRLPQFSQAVDLWKRMEGLFGFPQDVEWCVGGNQVSILQSRPLTSIQPQQYAEALMLDDLLAGRRDFLYEKTEISEVAPRPTPVTFSLLERLYAKDGPVEKAYDSLGVRFRPQPFLLLIGNELYVDRELEVRSFFPSASLLESDGRRPRMVRLRGALTSAHNQRALAAIDPARHLEEMTAEVRHQLSRTPAPQPTLREEAIEFCRDYRFIARLNILAAKAVRDLEALLADESVSAAAVLGGIRVSPEEAGELPVGTFGDGFVGNTLELMDATPFFRTSMTQMSMPTVERWWEGVRKSEKHELQELTRTALRFSRLREYGRWLTVRGVNRMRAHLFSLAEQCEVPPDEAFFVTLAEWEGAVPDSGMRQGRRDAYERASASTFPVRLTARCEPEDDAAPLGVSPGTTEGTLVSLETLDRTSGPVILWTPILSPELTQVLPRVTGVLSAQGGLLSHLSIIAREQHVPVVVGVPLETSGLSLGDRVRIDGAKGEVRVVG